MELGIIEGAGIGGGGALAALAARYLVHQVRGEYRDEKIEALTTSTNEKFDVLEANAKKVQEKNMEQDLKIADLTKDNEFMGKTVGLLTDHFSKLEGCMKSLETTVAKQNALAEQSLAQNDQLIKLINNAKE
jgi:hypothetical protein